MINAIPLNTFYLLTAQQESIQRRPILNDMLNTLINWIAPTIEHAKLNNVITKLNNDDIYNKQHRQSIELRHAKESSKRPTTPNNKAAKDQRNNKPKEQRTEPRKGLYYWALANRTSKRRRCAEVILNMAPMQRGQPIQTKKKKN